MNRKVFVGLRVTFLGIAAAAAAGCAADRRTESGPPSRAEIGQQRFAISTGDLRVGTQEGDVRHIVVMEYEPWHGKDAQNPHVAPARPPGYGNTVIHPTQTDGLYDVSVQQDVPWTDFDDVQHQVSYNLNYRHYDSGDARVIRWHRQKIQDLGADALLVDMTNGLEDFKNGFDWQVPSTVATASEHTFLNIKALYETYESDGNDLKIIPLVGAYDFKFFEGPTSGVLAANPADSGLGRLLAQWRALMEKFSGHNVLYSDDSVHYKPLAVFYFAPRIGLGVIDEVFHTSLVAEARRLMSATMPQGDRTYGDYFTFRFMGGLLDSAGGSPYRGPEATGTPAQRSQDPADSSLSYWSWVDRYAAGLTPAFAAASRTDGDARVEAFTVVNAVSSAANDGLCATVCDHHVDMAHCVETHRTELPVSCAWGRPAGDGYPLFYPTDTTLRRAPDGVWAFQRYMSVARALRPTFLFIHQWNQFEQTDQGFDFQTTSDLEPANWGVDSLTGQNVDDWAPYNMAKAELLAYRQGLDDPGKLFNGSLRTGVYPGHAAIVGFVHPAPGDLLVNGRGPFLGPYGIPNYLRQPQLGVYGVGGDLISADYPSSPGRDSSVSFTTGGGAYTAVLSPGDGQSGVGLLELFDTSAAPQGFSNFSGRAFFDAGLSAGTPIAGFVITGGPRRVLVTGRGGSLGQFGVQPQLGHPRLSIRNRAGQEVAFSQGQSNGEFDPWLRAVGAKVGAYPFSSDDAAVVIDLTAQPLVPEPYTAVMTGDASGESLIEVYGLPD